MPTSLHAQLQQLAASFADSVLAAVRSSSIDELVAQSSSDGAPRRGSAQGFRKQTRASAAASGPRAVAKRMPALKSFRRLARRSPEDIATVVDQVVALVKKHKEGLRAERIRVELGLMAKEMPRVLKDGLAAKKLTAKGQKRATTYFAK